LTVDGGVLVKSVRLDAELEERLRLAARALGVSESAFIRQSLGERCDVVLGNRLDERLRDVLGVVCSDGGRARSTGAAFIQVLRDRRKSR
jgi:hypothetical protein